MKIRRLTGLLLAMALVLAVSCAMAANTFLFTEKTVSLFEGEKLETALRRDGVYAGEGEIVYASTKPKIAIVSEEGVIEALSKGQTTVTATLRRNGKQVGRAQLKVNVLRAVTEIHLNTDGLTVYDAEDPVIAGLLKAEEEPVEEGNAGQSGKLIEASEEIAKDAEGITAVAGEDGPTEKASAEGEDSEQVLVISAGATVTLKATCLPKDASSLAFTCATSDEAVAKWTGKALKGMGRGECLLTVASAQNPEVTEEWRLLVIQPVKKITIDAGSKKVAVGSTLQLSAVCEPSDASIREVTWESANPAIAEVDANGVVTGLKKGNVTLTALAADGGRALGKTVITVTQPVTGLQVAQQELQVVAGRAVQARVTVLPAGASDKALDWFSSDESVATVQAGRVTGKKAGSCTVTCRSRSNPEIAADIPVTVSQLATKIEFTNPAEELSLRVGERLQLDWVVLPEDTTNPEVSLRSSHPAIAAVDANGIVTALSRGVATVVATAQDGSKKQGSVKITVIQPVTGVAMQRDLYYVQKGVGTSVRAVVEPRNANNQKVYWFSEDESIATVRSNGASTGFVQGYRSGTTVITAETEDGGYTASTRVKVDDFNAAVLIEDLEVNARNQIKIVLRNMSEDLVLENIYFRVFCYNTEGQPMICNTDGKSTWFDGSYPFELYPRDQTVHGSFRFHNAVIEEQLGAVVLVVTRWTDAEGVTWTIPESERLHRQWTNLALFTEDIAIPDQE